MADQKILLIEDNPFDIRLIKEMMKDFTAFNYTLVTAETLKEGCKQVKENNIILILLDLNLPDSTGKQTFNTLIDCAKNIPVVLLTGLQDMELSFALIKEGAQDYISKQDLNSNLLSKTIQYGIERDKQLKKIREISEELKQMNAELNISIAQRQLSEESLLKSERNLVQLNNDKNLFISILSHDLRTHFYNLLGLSEMLTDGIPKLKAVEIENAAKNIHETTNIAYKLLEDILMWAKTQQGRIPFRPRSLSFEAVCNDTIKALKPNAASKNIYITCSGVHNLNIIADIDMLETVMRNLVSNAIKFTNNNGVVNISALQSESKITISVSDNGIGIPPENMSKLFDISVALTTKGTAKEKGSGLGLLICKDFVEKHGGELWVESEAGRGSDFRFTLPVQL